MEKDECDLMVMLESAYSRTLEPEQKPGKMVYNIIQKKPSIKDFQTPFILDDDRYGLIINFRGNIIGQYNREEYQDKYVLFLYKEELGDCELVNVVLNGKTRIAISDLIAEIDNGDAIEFPENPFR